jgi:pyruvate formate lyase activating enzyme
MIDTAEAAKKMGVRNVVVTAGHINREPLADLLQVVDAVKIDLKGFTQDFYTKYVRGELRPVLDAIRTVSRSRAWLEIVYLVIPTLNDRTDLIREMAHWIKGEIGDHVPVHFSRFVPMYLLKNLPPTPVSTLERSREAALAEGLKFVYVGNVPGHPAENTFCPSCGTTVIERAGYRVRNAHLEKGRCEKCGQPIAGIWT